jgi:hypothetical protein
LSSSGCTDNPSIRSGDPRTQDQKAYILSVNINRRHMTAGQRTMAVAMIYPESDGVGGRGKKGKASVADGFSKTRLKMARAVIRFAPELVAGVLAGQPSLDFAYEKAIARKAEAATAEEKMARLRADAPDLAEQPPSGV